MARRRLDNRSAWQPQPDHRPDRAATRPGRRHRAGRPVAPGRPDGREEYAAATCPARRTSTWRPSWPTRRGERRAAPAAGPRNGSRRRCAAAASRAGRPVVVYDDGLGHGRGAGWWLLRVPRPSATCGCSTAVGSAGCGRVGRCRPARSRCRPATSSPAPAGCPWSTPPARLGWRADGVLVDARAPSGSAGRWSRSTRSPGHIPGAVNVPTAREPRAARRRAGRFRDRRALAATYAGPVSRPVPTVGVYCGSGVTAAHDVLALELVGVAAAMYPGRGASGSATRPGRCEVSRSSRRRT